MLSMLKILVIYVASIFIYIYKVLYEKFFESVRPKYNQGQLASIKDVCLSRNGICLLQGPVTKFK